MKENEIKELLNGNTSFRGDCPVCGGSNTFSINRKRGKVKWKCFKAHCKEKGAASINRSFKELSDQFRVRYHRQGIEQVINTYEIPSYFTGIREKEYIFQYFSNVNAIPLFENRIIKLYYDPKEDRAVFVVERGGAIIDAIGKALNRYITPKWYRYNNSNKSFLLRNRNNKDTLVITEDIPSAITVAYNYNSMALMGTSLKDEDVLDVFSFKRCIIALDPDAYSKGIAMAKRLDPFLEVEAIRIDDDLKYYTPSYAKDMIEERTKYGK